VVFGLTEILTPEKLLEANDLGAPSRRVPHTLEGVLHVLLGIRGAAHLHQPEGYGARGRGNGHAGKIRRRRTGDHSNR